MKVIAFAASNSRHSINKQLVTYAASLIPDAEVEVLDLNEYEMPLFSVDQEAELGKHPLAQAFLDKIAGCEALVISFAEHNGCYTAAYKNLFDWCSRINPKVYQDKPMVLLSTSPGGRGGAGVLEFATKQMPFFKGDVKASLAIPSFNDHFDKESGVLKAGDLHDQLVTALSTLT